MPNISKCFGCELQAAAASGHTFRNIFGHTKKDHFAIFETDCEISFCKKIFRNVQIFRNIFVYMARTISQSYFESPNISQSYFARAATFRKLISQGCNISQAYFARCKISQAYFAISDQLALNLTPADPRVNPGKNP